MNEEQEQSQELIPVEQQTLLFYDKPLIVIRLPDGRPGVVLRFLCENLHLDTNGQARRIRRTEAITDDLVNVRVETEGGSQKMATLVLRAVPYWLAGISPRHTSEEMRPVILAYQREVVDVLYAWAQQPKTIATSTDLVPSKPITQPASPATDAPLTEWREYHQQMVIWIDWQADIERWRGSVEGRLEGLEAVTGLIPEILDRLGPQTLTPEHQRAVQAYVHQLHQLMGRPYGTIYDNLKTAFGVAKYSDIPDERWNMVAR